LSDDIRKIREERRWYERARFILDYHTTKGKDKSGKRNDKWKVSDTAQKLGLSIGAVSEAIHLARAIKTNPDLRLKTREEALTILRTIKNGDDE